MSSASHPRSLEHSRQVPTDSTSSPSAAPSPRRAMASTPPRPGPARNRQGNCSAVDPDSRAGAPAFDDTSSNRAIAFPYRTSASRRALRRRLDRASRCPRTSASPRLRSRARCRPRRCSKSEAATMSTPTPLSNAVAPGQQRSRTRARLLCARADERGSQPCVARHLVLVKFETMGHGGNDVLQTQPRCGPNTFRIHNYRVQLHVTYTTSLSGYTRQPARRRG